MVRSAAQSFPHRGSPSTSHARVRWQPYSNSALSIPTRPSPLAYLVTPASSISSVSPSPRALSEPDHPRHVYCPPREPKVRDIQKSKFALGLVDQAVKSLCDIWPQEDIPAVFLTSGRPMVSPISGPEYSQSANTIHPTSRITYLPSPISPTTQHTPSISPVASSPASETSPFAQLQRCSIAPIKGFVHEVIRRSRTSGTVLQTALCYLEAIRSKIPELIRQEKQGISSSSPVALDNWISQGEVGIDYNTDLEDSPPTKSSLTALLATVRVDPYAADTPFSTIETDPRPAPKSKINNVSLPPLPALPSPLLCPRRAFLASLILASKFMQDRCYSNRAWAKLSGLPPREIGRCERALGEALEWRLWVGKLPAAQSPLGRTLTKTKSEGDILSGIPPMVQTVSNMDISHPVYSMVSPPGTRLRPLGRSATLPAGSLHLDGSCASKIDDASPTAYSSSPSTPGLSYSPTPTESSLGDRTVQMASFMDVPTPPPGQFATFTGAQNDKVLVTSVPSNGLFVYTGSQEVAMPALSQRIGSHCFTSHGVLPSNSVWFHDTI